MTRYLAQHLAYGSGDLAPMRLRHTVHLLQHGYHFGWLTILFTILLFALLIAVVFYRRGQSGSGQSSPAYRPSVVAPWQQSNVGQLPAAPWQSGMASSVAPRSGQPVYSAAQWTPPVAAPAWNAPQGNNWPAPVATPQWTR